jgi:hypothetical protein
MRERERRETYLPQADTTQCSDGRRMRASACGPAQSNAQNSVGWHSQERDKAPERREWSRARRLLLLLLWLLVVMMLTRK